MGLGELFNRRRIAGMSEFSYICNDDGGTDEEWCCEAGEWTFGVVWMLSDGSESGGCARKGVSRAYSVEEWSLRWCWRSRQSCERISHRRKLDANWYRSA